MPLYEVQCLKCDKEFEAFAKIAERQSIKCQCGGKTKILMSPPKKDWFKPFVSEDFNGEPILVRTKGHLKQLCEEHGVYSRALGYGRNLKEV